MDRQGRRRRAEFLGQRDEHVDSLEAKVSVDGRKLAELARGEAAAFRLGRIATVFACEESAGQGAPGKQRELLVQAERDDLVLDIATDQAIEHLGADEPLEPMRLRLTECQRNLPGRQVAEADVKDLAGLHN